MRNFTYLTRIFDMKTFVSFISSIILIFVISNKGYTQSKIWEDSFKGGVCTGGYSPEYQSGGEGTFDIQIESGSTIRKAFLMAGRFGEAKPLTVVMNGKEYLFDKNNMATKEYASRTYGGPSCVHVLDVTADIDPDIVKYTINVPVQGGPLNRYNDFYLFVAYENASMKKVNAAIFLRTTDISAHDKFNINLNIPTRKTSDIAISLYCGYICNKMGDGENVFLNGDKLGQLKGNDSNSGYCGGPIGSFYYKDNKMYALEDDNVDKKVSGSDALINAKTLLKDKCKTFAMDFEVDQSVYGPHETNSIWGVIIAYGTDDCKVKDATVSDDLQACKGSSVTLTASGADKYAWSTGSRSASIEVKPEVSTKYYVTITGGGCTERDTVDVDIFSSATVDAGKDTTVSIGADAKLKATGGNSYKWSTGEDTQSIIVNPLRTTAYIVTVSAGDCSATDKVTVNVTKEIKAYAGKDTTICSGSELSLKATGGENYLWSTGDKTQIIKVKPTVSTTYSVTVSFDSNTSTDEVAVNVVDLSKVDAGNDTTVCAGSPLILKASGGGSYKWSNGENKQSIIIRPKNTTTYIVTVSYGGCGATDKVTVKVNALPLIDAGPDITVLSDSSAVINVKGPNGKYKWRPESGLSCIDCKNPTVTPDSTTTYIIVYMSDNGCKATDTITVHSKIHQAYYITNPLTPNDDGENDIFMITLRRGKLLNYSIYDNKDRLIFKSTTDNYHWDGKYKNENMPTGVYIYYLNYVDAQGRTIQKTGTFYLIR